MLGQLRILVISPEIVVTIIILVYVVDINKGHTTEISLREGGIVSKVSCYSLLL